MKHKYPILSLVAVVALGLAGCDSAKSGDATFDFGSVDLEVESKTWDIELPKEFVMAIDETPAFTHATVEAENLDSSSMCGVRVTPTYEEGAVAAFENDGWDEALVEEIAEIEYQEALDQTYNLESSAYLPQITSEEDVIALEGSPQDNPLGYAALIGNIGSKNGSVFGSRVNDLAIAERTLYIASSDACYEQNGGKQTFTGLEVCGPALETDMAAKTDANDDRTLMALGSNFYQHQTNGLVGAIGEEAVSQAYLSTGIIPDSWEEVTIQVRDLTHDEYVKNVVDKFDNDKQEANPSGKLNVPGFGQVTPIGELDKANPKKGTYVEDDFSSFLIVGPCSTTLSPGGEATAKFGFPIIAEPILSYENNKWSVSSGTYNLAKTEIAALKDGDIMPYGNIQGWIQDDAGTWIEHK